MSTTVDQIRERAQEATGAQMLAAIVRAAIDLGRRTIQRAQTGERITPVRDTASNDGLLDAAPVQEALCEPSEHSSSSSV